jgi:hypothetical protein
MAYIILLSSVMFAWSRSAAGSLSFARAFAESIFLYALVFTVGFGSALGATWLFGQFE